MKNLKIQVNSESESREVQELFFKLGYKWNLHKGHYDIKNYPDIIRSHETGEMTHSISSEALYKRNKEITLPELRAMVDPMKEYLMPSRNYEYILTDAREALEPHAEDWIEIPEGAIRARFYPHDPDELEFENSTFQWWHNENNKWRNYENYSNTLKHSRVVWQRDQDQDEPFLTPECTLNDQYAEIEQVRQQERNSSAWDTQIGGDHYKQFQIQPMQFALENKLDAAQQNVIKYIMRHSFKNGKQDLEKAKHYIDLMIEFYYGEI